MQTKIKNGANGEQKWNAIMRYKKTRKICTDNEKKISIVETAPNTKPNLLLIKTQERKKNNSTKKKYKKKREV